MSQTAWTVSLAEIWGVPALPRISCETRMEGRHRFARCTPLDPDTSKATSSNATKTSASGQWFDLARPVKLLLHREGKPWGAELWYTGIEKRGVSGVETSTGEKLSLAAYLAILAGEENCRKKALPHVPLLKILDPLPEPNKGCLYIEVHTEKWETYIITSVDRRIWPDGRGRVLFGFSQSKMDAFGSDEERFKAALLQEVKAYEKIRRAIDSSECAADAALLSQENDAWERVRAYFGFLDVEPGSVVRVPPFIPHSLQNGVQVVEFQTPTYERLILAFNQKVLTQNHWDSEAALRAAIFKSSLQLTGGADGSAEISRKQVARWTDVVEFPEFVVRRAQIDAKSSLPWSSRSESISLIFVVEGQVVLRDPEGRGQDIRANAGDAFLAPPSVASWMVECEQSTPAIVLSV